MCRYVANYHANYTPANHMYRQNEIDCLAITPSSLGHGSTVDLVPIIKFISERDAVEYVD